MSRRTIQFVPRYQKADQFPSVLAETQGRHWYLLPLAQPSCGRVCCYDFI